MVFSIISTSLLSITIFYHASWSSLYRLAILEVLAAFCLAGLDAAIFYILGSLFPDKVRCLAITLSFTLSAAVFGGMSPLICTYLINKTGLTFIPSLYISILGFSSMIALFFLKRESYFRSISYNPPEVI